MLSFIITTLQFIFILWERTALCVPQDELVARRSTIFDNQVLQKVKTLFTRDFQSHGEYGDQTGQKKSSIAKAESGLHVKIDPLQFGEALFKQANQNAGRRSDIYMSNAIDAKALGIAVLKLIFGKDARMVMKDAKIDEDQGKAKMQDDPSKATSSTSQKMEMAVKKSLEKHSHDGGEREKNMKRLISLIKESHKNTEQGVKKSWVLLKIPPKQPRDELGMLTDPSATAEDGSNDDHSSDGKTVSARKNTDNKDKRVRGSNKVWHITDDNKRLMTDVQKKVKHLAQLIRKDKEEEDKSRKTEATQQSNGVSFPGTGRVTSKARKIERVKELKTPKTDTKSYENSVKNLLSALKSSVQTHKLKDDGNKQTEKTHSNFRLIPSKRKEEHASSKDFVNVGNGSPGGSIVSMNSLRQLGQLLGLSPPHKDIISPYTGGLDTLTLASPMLNARTQALAKPIASLLPPKTPSTAAQNLAVGNTGQESSSSKITEQLKKFAERGLQSHNDYRYIHHAEPLNWDEDLASSAEKLAYQGAKKGFIRRSELVEKNGYGENVVKLSNTALEKAGEEATRRWYEEKQNFTFSDPVISEGTKSFTQLIWKETRRLGMGVAKDDDTGELYIVALYSPKGNELATLRENLVADGEKKNDVYASIFKKSATQRHP